VAECPPPPEGIVLAHFIVSDDVERSQTPPKQHQYERRCYIRDPGGHLIEAGQTTDPEGDWSPAHWPSSTPAAESG
jgi:hypothetical protein